MSAADLPPITVEIVAELEECFGPNSRAITDFGAFVAGMAGAAKAATDWQASLARANEVLASGAEAVEAFARPPVEPDGDQLARTLSRIGHAPLAARVAEIAAAPPRILVLDDDPHPGPLFRADTPVWMSDPATWWDHATTITPITPTEGTT